jgi:4-hydroxy-2-oxovalerate aldolase
MAERPTILDCTIRDGSYAIDFKFTAGDTALLAGLLDRAGLRYIEIGHGLGLGASEAGKGRAGSRDLEVIQRTRESVSDGRIGAFFIPGIGTEADLREAAAAGLDFIRVGQNADEIEDALPFLELARELGLEPFLNFMKTYGISPEQFAHHAVQAADRGAAGVYVVDSAGGMLPTEVSAYVRATREATTLPVGFHGHSNLHLAVANSVAAWEAGATFVDTSVYGIGRSSGNVPTEVMAAVFERLGVDCGIDAMDIIDIAESYLLPLAEHLHPHTMTAVALGYGRFHSAFLPRALQAAEEADVNPYRLIVELGRQDMMRLPDRLLNETVTRLAGSEPPARRLDVARFSDLRFGPRRITTRPEALTELLDALEVVAAKRHLAVVLDLVPSPALDEEAVNTEFVLEDGHMALGRLRFGSTDAAAAALGDQASRIDLALIDGADAPTIAALAKALPHRLVAYRSDELELEYLGDVGLARAVAEKPQGVVLVDPGTYAAPLVDALAGRIAAIADVTRAGQEVPEHSHAVVLVAGPLGSASGAGTERAIFIGAREGPDAPPSAVVLQREDAYSDMLPRWRRALDALPRLEAARL